MIHNFSLSELQDELVLHRRHIHSYPELGYNEFETTKYITSILDSYNISYKKVCKTGIVAEIGAGHNCVALRAELDALPIQEKTNLEFSSKNVGKMHACGHDMHLAMLLGAAKLLKFEEKNLRGKVRLFFQPAEEVLPGGASLMIQEGVLSEPDVKYVFAQHIDPMQEAGTVHIPYREAMASTNELFWTVSGKSSHAAQPHLGNDIILAAANIVNFMQSINTKFRNPMVPLVVSICAINGGNTTNIFPSVLKMQGVMRTFDKKLRKEIEEIIINKSAAIAELYGAKCEVEIAHGYPALINDKKAVDIVFDSAKQTLGNENVQDCEPKLLAEDFAYFSEEVPSCFWFLGAAKQGEVKYGLHNPMLNPDESILIKGANLFANIAQNALKKLNK